MSQVLEEEKQFIAISKNYVNAIENYTGDDPLELWYKYLLWMEENYVIDFSVDNIFDEILCSCIAKFESDGKYKQDRRLIKLFIKYINYQDSPEKHYSLLHENGYGKKVSDLYICWAHFYDFQGDFHSARYIYQLGITAKAEPIDRLEQAQQDFTIKITSKDTQRLQNDIEYQAKEKEKINLLTSLQLQETATTTEKCKLLPKTNQTKLLQNCMPFYCNRSPPSMTPDNSLIYTIVTSSRKQNLKLPHLLVASGHRLSFGNEFQNDQLNAEENMYAKGIKLSKYFVRQNLPQPFRCIPSYKDPPNLQEIYALPGYDKIMLLPAADKSYSIEELNAYKWYKKRNITNDFTIEQDQIWEVGFHVPFRWPPMFAQTNDVQDNDFVINRFTDKDFILDEYTAFGINIHDYYPSNTTEEYSFEEILWKKRNAFKNKKNYQKVLSTVIKKKAIIPELQVENQQSQQSQTTLTNSLSSKVSMSASTGAIRKIPASTKNWHTELVKAKASSEIPYAVPVTHLNCKSNTEINMQSLNDICATQTVTSSLNTQSCSTPKAQKNQNYSMNASNLIEPVLQNIAEPQKTINEVGKLKLEPTECDNILSNSIQQNATINKSTATNLDNKCISKIIISDKSQTPNNVNHGHKSIMKEEQPMVKSENNESIQKAQNSAASFTFEISQDQMDQIEDFTNAVENCLQDLCINSNSKTVAVNEKIVKSQMPAQFQIFKDSICNGNDTNCNELNPFSPLDKAKTMPKYNCEVNRIEYFERSNDLDISIPLTKCEKNELLSSHPIVPDFNFNNPSPIIATTKQNQNEEMDNDENDEHALSIYVKQPEVKFSEEKHADWLEVTQYIANGCVDNEYLPDVIDMNETQQKIETHLLNLCPFDSELHKALLDNLCFTENLSKLNSNRCSMVNIVHPLKPKNELVIGERTFNIQKMIGSGNFGNVFSGECATSKKVLALKQERPANLWEYYVCLEVCQRIKCKRIQDGFMNIEYAIIGKNATVFASKFSKFGTLINVCNKVKTITTRNVNEYIVMILAKQMFLLIDSLHRANIIHADLKPDNFLLMSTLEYDYDQADLVLQLIDFGQSIDMKLFPKKQVFYSKLKTENFVCTEMMENKPWTYQTDHFCLASTIYTMVCGKYMSVFKKGKTTTYQTQTIPRYYNKKLWSHIFDTLINIPDCNSMPNLLELCQLLDAEITAYGSKMIKQNIVEFNSVLLK